MIVFTMDDNGLIKTISDQLGEYHSKAPTVLKQALNATAKDARTLLADKAKDVYVIQKSRFNKAMSIKNASAVRMEAIIRTTGEALETIDFKTSSKSPAYGGKGAPGVKAQVKRGSSMKELNRGGVKAFITRFESDHVALVQRVIGKYYKIKNVGKRVKKYGMHADITKLKKLLSLSIPQMVGNEKEVYGEVKPQIAELLDANIRKYIDKTISKGAKV